ncbi:pentapeptide repeat-containing protein [Nocardia sp. NPDC058176]|uniref:pentapeptide repeat-containing protein n=1 Tax=Nocardia sp. NPDC058176 TaxID=3346368 RepID=UPI0036DC1709
MTTRWVWAGAAVGVSIAAVVGVSWFVVAVPDRLLGADGARMTAVERVTAVTAIRAQLITYVSVLGGLVVVAYGVYRYYLEKAKQRLDEDKHLTGLFDSAAGRLADPEPAVRAVAVRTLFRLMVDSPRDHLLVLHSMGDVLRRYAVHDQHPDGRLSPEVAAAVDALRDRPHRDEPRPLDLTGVWLRGADLTGAVLRGVRLGRPQHPGADLSDADLTAADLTAASWPRAHLSGARLHRARLHRTDFTAADLTGADLTDTVATEARLTDATLFRADLSRADLREANLSGARLRGAILESADLTGASLTGADLSGTDLRTVRGLTETMVRATTIDATTALPPGMNHPELPVPSAG